MRQNGQPFSVGYTTFYRQNLCRGQYLQKTKLATTAHMEVSSLLFFLLKLLLHTVYIFNILMWTEVIDSKRL